MNKKAKRLLKENNELSKLLQPGDESALTDMVVYIRAANISDYQQELIRRDITQMIIDAENRGHSAREAIGEDYKLFCDNVLEEIPRLSLKDRAINFAGDMCLYLAILCSIWFCFGIIDFFTGKSIWPYFPVTLGNVVTAVLIVCFATSFITFMAKNAFNYDYLTNKKVFFSVFIALFVGICTNIFLQEHLFSIHAAAAAGILLLFIVNKFMEERET